MRKTLPLALLALSLCGQAIAAETHWTGFYFGLNAGHSGGDDRTDAALSGLWTGDMAAPSLAQALSVDGDVSGNSVGLQVGYDHQFANGWLLGVELDYQRPGIDETTTTVISNINIGSATQFADLRATSRLRSDDAWSLRPRLGYVTGKALWYITAGYSRRSWDVASDYTFNVPAFSSSFSKAGGDSGTANGLVWGAGVDWRFADRWSAGLRYTRTREESFDYAPTTTTRSGLYLLVPTDTAIEEISRKVQADNLSLTLNYRF
ncbi:outer membrane protein [Arenimonas sp. MALMAid1274]|uniref:outer membrane protein n=1 Tax=Arenimonas sp. MALMAid1274 TaxID=3411630 RepID=UPI003BA14FA4